ncbi:hypothetical protein D3C86_1033890 [compost metagenome]
MMGMIKPMPMMSSRTVMKMKPRPAAFAFVGAASIRVGPSSMSGAASLSGPPSRKAFFNASGKRDPVTG